MHAKRGRRSRRVAIGCCAALATLAISAVGGAAADAAPPTYKAGDTHSGDGPVVKTHDGKVRGVTVDGTAQFRGLPYAAPPVKQLRWQPPQPPAAWQGVRDATKFAAICPQPETPYTTGPTSEDCLYLNVYAPSTSSAKQHPVLVWIHGGGFSIGSAKEYDATKLAKTGTVVVTIEYRLGLLGFLAHPALAGHRGGPTGNYGLMDQQAALRWVQQNIGKFGGDPHDVTIDGQSAGGLSVLEQLVSPGARGLFQRAIVQSGAFALKQRPLAAAETEGKTIAVAAGCADQSAKCLRNLPVSKLLANAPASLIPGVVDGKVLKESIGSALKAGRFARVPIINGSNHDEERLFLTIGSSVSGGASIPLPEAITAQSYEAVIASTFGMSQQQAASIAAEYPLASYPTPRAAFSALDTDANFSCPALTVDRWTAKHVPTFAYEFNDDNAPERFVPQTETPTVATHQSELQYLFDLPEAPVPGKFSASQEALASTMRQSWANFAASGDPAGTGQTEWPSFDSHEGVLSLVPPKPTVSTDFAVRHHCGFWADNTH